MRGATRVERIQSHAHVFVYADSLPFSVVICVACLFATENAYIYIYIYIYIYKRQLWNETTLWLSVKTIALGRFCGVKYTRHTFTASMKHH